MLRPLLVAAALVLTPGGVRVASAATPPRVEYVNDRLTVHAEDTPVSSILDALKEKSGADVRGTAPADPVTVDFEGVQLHEALQRLLGDQSFTLKYGEKGLKSIELKGGPQAPTPKEEAEPRPIGPTKKQIYDGVANVFWARGPIPLSGRLATAEGADQVGYGTLFKTASENEDRGLRMAAWRAGLRALEADPEQRNALIEATGSMDDAELTAFLRSMANMTPDSAEDIIKWIIRDTRVPEFRARARAVLRQLRMDRETATAGR